MRICADPDPQHWMELRVQDTGIRQYRDIIKRNVPVSYLKYRGLWMQAVFRIRIHLNPDPTKNLYPDPDPEDLESGPKLFLNTI